MSDLNIVEEQEMEKFFDLISEVLEHIGYFVNIVKVKRVDNVQVFKVEDPASPEALVVRTLLDSFVGEKAKKYTGDFYKRALEAWYECVPMFQYLREVDHKHLEEVFLGSLDRLCNESTKETGGEMRLGGVSRRDRMKMN